MVKTQIILYWASIAFYVLATFFIIAGAIFKKTSWFKPGYLLPLIGIFPHTASLVLRWSQTGHFPYWGAYEVLPGYAWALILIYLVFAFNKNSLRVIGGAIMPIASILIGIGVMSSTEVTEIPRTYFTYWLGVHIFFAVMAVISAVLSASLAALFLLKDRDYIAPDSFLDKIPAKEKLDALSYRFGAFAFIMLGIMIASGAVWAYKAWGKYWSWDPIETASLISWFIYAIYLHLRVTMGWKGRKAAWLAIIAFISTLFSYYGVPLVADTIHEHLK